MGYWRTETTPAKDGAPLTGKFSDDDRRSRLHVFGDMLVRAEAAVAPARRAFDAEIAAARRDGQGAIADEALKNLAERTLSQASASSR